MMRLRAPRPCQALVLGLLIGLPAIGPHAADESALIPSDGPALSAASLPADLPPPPKGYKSNAEVMLAIGLKAIKPISQPKEVPEGVVETRNLEYARIGDRSLQLDLYQPAKLDRPVPGLVFIHGGGWSGGSREVYKYYTVRYAQRGYVAATISYRLVGEAPYPAAVEDAKSAVRWLRANAAKYHIDPDRLAAVGGSAGGHLAMMLGYSADAKQFERMGGNPGVSSGVQAVINFYGPFDMTTPFARTNSTVQRFLSGKTYDEAPELYRESSPANYLRAGAPPTLIFHGTIDEIVPIDQADLLARRLKELRVPFVYDRLEGWPHTLDLAESVNERCQALMNRFLAKHLPLPQ
jgi:acetyl esterase/lipase